MRPLLEPGSLFLPEAPLDLKSSVGAYEEPRIRGVPCMVNLGVPMRHDGILMFKTGVVKASKSSIVLGRWLSPGIGVAGCDGSMSAREAGASWIVLSEIARRNLGRARFRSSANLDLAPKPVGSLEVAAHCVDGGFVAVVGVAEKPAVPGGVTGN